MHRGRGTLKLWCAHRGPAYPRWVFHFLPPQLGRYFYDGFLVLPIGEGVEVEGPLLQRRCCSLEECRLEEGAPARPRPCLLVHPSGGCNGTTTSRRASPSCSGVTSAGGGWRGVSSAASSCSARVDGVALGSSASKRPAFLKISPMVATTLSNLIYRY